VVDIPAKYLNSLQDIIESNRTPGLVGGFDLQEDFETSQGENRFVKRMILKRIKERNTIFDVRKSTNAILDIAQQGVYHKMVIMFASEQYIPLAKNMICLVNSCPELIPKPQVSKPFDQVITGRYYSSKIDKQVAYRLDMTYKWLQQSGVLMSESIPETTMICRLHMERKQEHKKNEVKFPFFVFETALKCFSIALVFASKCFIFECFTPRIVKYISIQSKEKQKRLWIKTLKFLCKIIIPKEMKKKNKDFTPFNVKMNHLNVIFIGNQTQERTLSNKILTLFYNLFNSKDSTANKDRQTQLGWNHLSFHGHRDHQWT